MLINPLTAGAVMLAASLAAAIHASETSSGAALELSDCRIYAAPGRPGIKARCGTFERHLDPTDPGSTVLQLNVALVPALSLEPEPDPLVVIAGGPGGATVSFYAASSQAFEKLRRHRDILLLDQRGTGKSAPMTCDIDDDVLEGQFDVEETLSYTQICLDELPYDPRFFTTSVAVRDLEALRLTLGIPSLNLYGISYGTRVAQHYARRYPESTRSVVLDGVVPPQLPLGPGIAIEAQNALQAIFDRCAQSADCSGAFPDLVAEFSQLETDLTQEAVSLVIPHPVTGEQRELDFGEDEFALAIRLMSYSSATIALMPLLIHEAAAGNFAPLAAAFLNISEGLSEELAIGMHNAVVCTEDAPFYDDIDVRALEKTYIGPNMVETLKTICSIWPAGIIDDDLRTPLATDIPVLLLSGSADPITPPRFASLAAVDLDNFRQVVGTNQGHGQAPLGCMPEIIEHFVTTASVDDLDTDCAERLFTMPFFTSHSGPAP